MTHIRSVQKNDATNGFNPTKTHRDVVGFLQDDLELTWPLRTDRLEAEVGHKASPYRKE